MHGPKEEQHVVEVGSPWLNKVESESENIVIIFTQHLLCCNGLYLVHGHFPSSFFYIL